ncbi:uncharacterized protein [Henckelia pumila]|uniref:uncharacterized protein isoform X2 n=1 Tax=Henckelia pumila TaxID=405737 RepID=UPI003C6E17F2
MNLFYWFESTIYKIENKSNPWYEACGNCLKAITKTSNGNNCKRCVTVKLNIIPRYRLTLLVQEDDLIARLTLFEEAATMLIGLQVNEFINQEEALDKYLQRFEQQKDEKYKFLFKLDHNVEDKNQSLSIIVEALEKSNAQPKNVNEEKKRKAKQRAMDIPE